MGVLSSLVQLFALYLKNEPKPRISSGGGGTYMYVLCTYMYTMYIISY